MLAQPAHAGLLVPSIHVYTPPRSQARRKRRQGGGSEYVGGSVLVQGPQPPPASPKRLSSGTYPAVDGVFDTFGRRRATVLGAFVVHAAIKHVVEDESRVGGRLDAQVEPREGGVAAVLLRSVPRRLREGSEKAPMGGWLYPPAPPRASERRRSGGRTISAISRHLSAASAPRADQRGR